MILATPAHGTFDRAHSHRWATCPANTDPSLNVILDTPTSLLNSRSRHASSDFSACIRRPFLHTGTFAFLWLPCLSPTTVDRSKATMKQHAKTNTPAATALSLFFSRSLHPRNHVAFIDQDSSRHRRLANSRSPHSDASSSLREPHADTGKPSIPDSRSQLIVHVSASPESLLTHKYFRPWRFQCCRRRLVAASVLLTGSYQSLQTPITGAS